MDLESTNKFRKGAFMVREFSKFESRKLSLNGTGTGEGTGGGEEQGKLLPDESKFARRDISTAR